MLSKLWNIGRWYDIAVFRVANLFGMVYIHHELIVKCREQVEYLEWLSAEMMSTSEVREEMLMHLESQRFILEYLTVGKNLAKEK